ncbi:15608_t:CDS:2 [Cetraspora pellucida]|uniref:15608_t:CDS:1 n=1 Tax=Cetraspora pellucida TaxID=1433469 RepID=A0A9N9CSY8_9GLOM|nr:15608_t:CDS:2 [Cetraspora pellucida]
MLTTNFNDVYSPLSIIFILSQNFLNVRSFRPEPRGGHMATLVNKKIIYMGGSRPIPKTSSAWTPIHQFNLSDEVFSLDLSSPFTVDSPPFTDLSATSKMPFGGEKGKTVLGTSSIRIFLVGGVQQNMATFAYNVTNSSLWIYNVNSQLWDVPGPGTNGPPLPMRRSTATVIDKNGMIYIFGGRVEVDTGSDVFTIFDDFFTFDTLLLKWTNLTSLPNHPYKRSHTTTTLMPDGKIIYIGGVTQSIPGQTGNRISMNESAVGTVDPRVGHTSILAPDNSTIVILGGTQSYALNQTTAYPVFVLLDVKSEPFQYSTPQPSGLKFKFVLTGNITNDAGPPTNTSADVYLMDLSNYTWVTRFDNSSTSTTSNNGKLAIIICPIIIALVIGIIICFKLYGRKMYESSIKVITRRTRPEPLPKPPQEPLE